MQEETSTFLDTGSFTINNRNNLDTTDDIKAIFNVTIPQDYTIGNVYDAIGKNQFMYAYIELPTLSTSATTDATVILKEINNSVTTEVTRVNFHNANVFNQTFNVYDIIKTKLDELETSDINFSFELTLEGQNNTTISYSLGGDLIGEKPKLKIGYLSDAGLSNYYTYEALPLSDLSNIYIAHNSGNLTYVFNDYTDNNLLNFSHIYNDNRKHKDSVYGNGYSINYNEYITTFSTDNKLLLTEGDGREIIYYSTNSTNTEYLASDGSGNLLRKILSSSTVTGYEIETDTNELKTYDSSGKLIKIYSDVKKRVNGVWNNDTEFVSLTYTNNKLTKISDSYGNYINLIYSSNYLSEIKVYKYSPTLSSTRLVSQTFYEYVDGNLTEIDRFIGNTLTNEVRVTYDTKKHSTQILDNSIGYKLTYDNQNRIKKAKVYSSSISNGDYVDFTFSPNGKKTIVTNGLSEVTSYTFDDYYHTSSVESSTGYTTFYKYEDIYYDSSGNSIASPNYNLNHKIKVQSNSFKNVYNLINNHGFEIVTSSGIYGWNKELTSSSTATIDATSILYGSRVLKLYKASSGVAKVYQDIEVEANTEYIITGYIKNTNSAGGAYITVEGQETGGIVSKISSSGVVKSTNDFVKYEYKFKTDFDGTVRVILENTSTGYAYFDNIQINTSYLDTRYNYLTNSSFEDIVLSGWSGYDYLVEERNDAYFNENCGEKSVKLTNYGYISQTINIVGNKGDIFVFGGYCFYENYTGDVSVKLTFTTANGTETKIFKFLGNDINAVYYMDKYQVNSNYTKVKIEVVNNSNSSYAYLDNFAIYKEGYGVNLTYNENGKVTEKYNEITDEKEEYTYDENDNLSQVKATTNSSDNENKKTDTTNINYNPNEVISSISSNNVTTSLERDSNNNVIKATSEVTDSLVKEFHSSTTYTQDGLFPATSTDVFGNVTEYTYDYLTGLVTTIIASDGITTNYTYDDYKNVVQMVNGKDSNTKTVTYTYDEYSNLTSITSDGLTYTFTYNKYNDLKSISVGGDTLLTNNYKNESSSSLIYSGVLNNTEYNYGTIYFEYDEENRVKNISEKTINGTKVKILEYTYNDYGEISSYTDLKENVTYYYNYDYQNRLINVNSTNGNNIVYEYDEYSNLVKHKNINGENVYSYQKINGDYKLTEEDISNLYDIEYTYSNNSYSNLVTISYYLQTNSIDKKYTYEVATLDNETYYTGRVKSFEYVNGSSSIVKYIYTYDKNNNITNILGYENNSLVYKEINTYDIFNELIKQELTIDGIKYTSEYTYDSRGNITSYIYKNVTSNTILKSYTYSYKTTGNKDRLLSLTSTVDNKTYNITYSTNKEASLYLGWQVSYNMKNIVSLINDEYDISYTYNANNIRTKKVVVKDSITLTTNYILEGNKIIKEIRSDGQEIEYYYDINEEVIGFKYNNNKYLYIKNLQKDVIGIVDTNNNVIVKYYYDGYGREIKVVDTSGISLSIINPIRYRSYYIDNETNWCYLNSRYYDREIGRFITQDEVEYLGSSGSVLSYNLYSYCNNNPVNSFDYNGNFAISIFIISLVIELV